MGGLHQPQQRAMPQGQPQQLLLQPLLLMGGLHSEGARAVSAW
jgi:hypothetical protein